MPNCLLLLLLLPIHSYKYKEYGLNSAFVAEELIKAFFAYWWPTPVGSPQRSKIMFSIKRGPLAGKAVAIIVNEGPACKDKTPSALAAYRGSSLFVYHQVGLSAAQPSTSYCCCCCGQGFMYHQVRVSNSSTFAPSTSPLPTHPPPAPHPHHEHNCE